MLDDEELDSYIALLAPTILPRVETLRCQLEADNLSGMVETAHALSGGSACYGLFALSSVARQVENGARSEPAESLRRLIRDAAVLVDDSLSAVLRWRCRLRAGPLGGVSPSVAEACILTAAIAAS